MSFRQRTGNRTKATTTSEDGRRRRENNRLTTRKERRDEMLRKKRMHTSADAKSSGLSPELAQAVKNDPVSVILQFKQMLCSNNHEEQLQGARQFREMLSVHRDPPIKEVVDAKVVPLLVEMLTASDRPQLQFEAAWAITNVASGSREDTKHVTDEGAVRLFVGLLDSPMEELQEQAVWALGNIAGDSVACRNDVLNEGALPPLLRICQQKNSPSLLRNAVWTLSNFFRGKPQPPLEAIHRSLPTLNHLLRTQKDKTILTDACWALSYITDDNSPERPSGEGSPNIDAVIDAHLVVALVDLLQEGYPSVITPALRTIGNIVTGSDRQTQAVINARGLVCLNTLLHNNHPTTRKETCWTLSNITAGLPEQIGAVIEEGLIRSLVYMVSVENYDIQKEACWALSNATSGGTDEQIRSLVENERIIHGLVTCLTCKDNSIVLNCADALEKVLQVGRQVGLEYRRPNPYAPMIETIGGRDTLAELQRHSNPSIATRATNIIREYFMGNQQEMPELAPQPGFGFGGGPASQQGPNPSPFVFGPGPS